MNTDNALVHVPDAGANTFAMLVPAADLADKIARTEFVPAGLRGKPDAIAACVLFGHEVGIPPMQSLSKIHVIDGRPAMAAELMRALILRAGHECWFEDKSNTKVTICGRRAEWPPDRVTRITWTMDDAKKAELDRKQNWRKYPRAMLTARATGELARDVFPDILGGISYTVEELHDGDEVDVLDDVDAGPATATRKAPAKRAAAKKAAPTAAKAAPLPTPEPPPLPDELDDIVDAEVIEEPAPVAREEANPEQPAPAEKSTEVKRSQMLVIKCGEVGISTTEARHAFVGFVTAGRVTSTKEVTSDECDRMVRLLDRIATGETTFTQGADGSWLLDDVLELDTDSAADDVEQVDDVVDAEVVTDSTEPDEGDPFGWPDPSPAPAAAAPAGDVDDPTTWDATEWKNRLAQLPNGGLRVTQALREASNVARELGHDAPTSAAKLAADPEIASLVWIWAVDAADAKGNA